MRVYRGVPDVPSIHARNRKPPPGDHELWTTRLLVALDTATQGDEIVVTERNVHEISAIIQGKEMAPRMDALMIGELIRGVIDEDRLVNLKSRLPSRERCEIKLLAVFYVPPIGPRNVRRAALESQAVSSGLLKIEEAPILATMSKG